MLYHQQYKRILYCPFPAFRFDKHSILSEVENISDLFGYISSKGKALQKVDYNGLTSAEADELERTIRLEQFHKRPNDFPVAGIMLRGLVPGKTTDKQPLKYSFSYLMTDISLYDWTDIVDELPIIKTFLDDFISQFDLEVGRIVLQTVEPNFVLHNHIDSIYNVNTNTCRRRQKTMDQLGIRNFNMDSNFTVSLVLSQGDGLTFYHPNGSEISTCDDFYYFAPELIMHGVKKSIDRRIILRIEGKMNTPFSDYIEGCAEENPSQLITL